MHLKTNFEKFKPKNLKLNKREWERERERDRIEIDRYSIASHTSTRGDIVLH